MLQCCALLIPLQNTDVSFLCKFAMTNLHELVVFKKAAGKRELIKSDGKSRRGLLLSIAIFEKFMKHILSSQNSAVGTRAKHFILQ